MISIVAAMANNRVIGKDGWMPWNLPEDLKFFRNLTLHHTLLMGRTTFDVIKKPLPQRFTYIATRQKEYTFDHADVEVIHSIEELLKQYKHKDETLFVCGGADVYKQALPYADELWLSLVDEHYEGDTFFPKFDERAFVLQTKEKKEGFVVCHYQRIKT